jgi:hypothetical protein
VPELTSTVNSRRLYLTSRAWAITVNSLPNTASAAWSDS